jgi:hypothetical protein
MAPQELTVTLAHGRAVIGIDAVKPLANGESQAAAKARKQ